MDVTKSRAAVDVEDVLGDLFLVIVGQVSTLPGRCSDYFVANLNTVNYKAGLDLG